MLRGLPLALLATVSCADPTQAWRADALDVSGQWALSSPAIDDATVDIALESSINDVRLVLRRGGGDEAVSPDEAEVIARLRDANDRLQARTALELGAGVDAVRAELTGGENVSLDGGDTAAIDVLSAGFAASNGGNGDTGDTLVRWGMSLEGDGTRLEGLLFLTERERTGSPGTTDTDLRTTRHEVAVTLVRR